MSESISFAPISVDDARKRAIANAEKVHEQRASTGEIPPVDAYSGEIPPSESSPSHKKKPPENDPFPDGVPRHYLQ